MTWKNKTAENSETEILAAIQLLIDNEIVLYPTTINWLRCEKDYFRWRVQARALMDAGGSADPLPEYPTISQTPPPKVILPKRKAPITSSPQSSPSTRPPMNKLGRMSLGSSE